MADSLIQGSVMQRLARHRIVPVAVIESEADILPTLKALTDGHLPVCEITFRTACAADAIRIGILNFPNMLIGAGTILNKRQCISALKAGAEFIVSPGYSRAVMRVCKRRGVPYIPGCVTPTEITQAVENGLEVVKFFPAQVYGGLAAINALGAAFPRVKFLPTGGIDNSNLQEYLANPKVFAVGGSWMLKGGGKEIKEKTIRAMQIVKGE